MDLSVLFIAFILLTLFPVMVMKLSKNTRHKKTGPWKTMIVLGSGGHTAEMIKALSTLDLAKFSPRCYVVAKSDDGPNGSGNKAEQFESKVLHKGDYDIIRIPRSRNVHQSWLSTPFTFLHSLMFCFSMVLREKPDVILCNGPGTCVPVCFVAYLLRLLGIKKVAIFYSESLACVQRLSFSGRLLYYITDRFFVQWKELTHKYKRASFIGWEGVDGDQEVHPPLSIDHNGYVLVTVGSTEFDELIKAIDRPEFVEMLKDHGYKGLHIQKGKGVYVPEAILQWSEKEKSFEVKVFDLVQSLEKELEGASLVISHGGVGSISETMWKKKPLVVVPNESLMNNHQLQIAQKLAKNRYIMYARLRGVMKTITKQISHNLDSLNQLQEFPQQDESKFAKQLEEALNR